MTETGRTVRKFKTGDKIGVGYMIGSCNACDSCAQGFENFCPKIVATSNGIYNDGTITYGGFSDKLVVDEHFAVRIPENLALDKTAPLLCAGVTVYSPMKHFGLDQPGKHLGVSGLGGLGHVAVKFGKAFGMKVTVISSSLRKEKEAIQHLGADAFLVSSNPEQMQVPKKKKKRSHSEISGFLELSDTLCLSKVPRVVLQATLMLTIVHYYIFMWLQAAVGTMDGIIDTVSASHAVAPLLSLLKMHGKMINLGLQTKPMEVPAFSLMQSKPMEVLSYSGISCFEFDP